MIDIPTNNEISAFYKVNYYIFVYDYIYTMFLENNQKNKFLS